MGSGKYRALFPSTSGQRLQIENTVGSCVSQVGSGTMQIIRECRMRATILTGIAKDAPELENQLL
jgi:hypothetical protein